MLISMMAVNSDCKFHLFCNFPLPFWFQETQFKLKQKLILRNTKMTLLPYFLIQRFTVKDKITRWLLIWDKEFKNGQVKFVKDSLWKIWKGYSLLKSILEYFVPYIIYIDINKLLAALKNDPNWYLLYLFEVYNGNIVTKRKICSKLTIKKLANDVVLVSLYLRSLFTTLYPFWVLHNLGSQNKFCHKIKWSYKFPECLNSITSLLHPKIQKND